MKPSIYSELKESLQEAAQIRKGRRRPARRHYYDAAGIRLMREKAGLSQSEFSDILGVSLATLQNWEQDRRHPSGSAQALLRVFHHDPKAVLAAQAG